jgi:N6-L-threonylcarbamoyladenine synthase
MYILAIETSCDETSIALLKKSESKDQNFLEYLNSYKVVSSIIASQAHHMYGGVIPEISARHHAEQIFELFDLVIQKAMTEEQITKNELLKSILQIAVTTEPGLVSALRVGQEFAKVIAYHIAKLGGIVSVHPTNHLRGHIISCFFENSERWNDAELFPHLHLLVSGGNTQLLLLTSPTEFTIVGQKIDDAAGECLDKIGRMVGLNYPAGATIGAIAKDNLENRINLPFGLKGRDGFNFSYSGLKTAVRYYIRDHAESGIVYEQPLTQAELEQLKIGTELSQKLRAIQDILVSTQTVVIEQLIRQTRRAIKETKPKSIGLSGGVSASRPLRTQFTTLHEQYFVAPLPLTGDNAIMIGLAHLASQYPTV